MAECLCGCGQETSSTGKFLPGHDQKLRISFEKSIGGLENLLFLKTFVDEIGTEKFFKLLKVVKEIKISDN